MLAYAEKHGLRASDFVHASDMHWDVVDHRAAAEVIAHACAPGRTAASDDRRWIPVGNSVPGATGPHVLR